MAEHPPPALSFSDHLRRISASEAGHADDCGATAALAEHHGWPVHGERWRNLQLGHLTQAVRYAALAEDYER